MDGPQRELRSLNLLALVCVMLTLTLGVTKLFVQRAHLPSYATPTYNTYEGFVSIDQYCIRAEKMRDRVQAGPDEVEGAQAEMMKDLRKRGHPSAILIPAIIALVSIPVGSIPYAFIGLVIAALLLQFLAVRRLASRLTGGAAPAIAIATVLVASHCDTVRSSAQLLLDPFAALFTTLTVLVSQRRHEGGGAGTTWTLVALQLLGPFIKLSYLPALAAPAIVTLCVARENRIGGALLDGIRFGLLPVLPAVAYVLAVPTLDGFGREMDQTLESSSMSSWELGNFAIEMALLLAPLVVLLWRPKTDAARIDARTGSVLLVVLTFLLSLWALRLPDDHRLYLPLIGLMAAAVAARVWDAFGPARTHRWLAIYATLNYGVALAGILLVLR